MPQPEMPAEAEDAAYQVKLENVFEGPMDLLVYLIRKNEVDIYDIPIALITQRYLDYLAWMKAMSIEVAGNFILMAATLMQIKSRMLLPRHGDVADDDEDPRLELVRPLEEYLKLKAAASLLAERQHLLEDTFVRGMDDSLLPESELELASIGLFDLLEAFQRILDQAASDYQVDVTTEHFSVQDKINELSDILELHGSLTFDALFAVQVRRADIVVTFLALLEMAKLGLARIVQHVNSGIIRIFYA